MKLELINDEWTQVTGLEEDTTYFLQAKKQVCLAGSGHKHSYIHVDINLAFGASTPTDDRNAGFGSAWKFKKDSSNVYVKADKLPCIVYIVEAN